MRCAGRNIKGLTISDARYYESESANANDSKGDPARNLKIATQTSDGKKGKVTDTRNGDLQQKLLSNRILPIITMSIEPQIDNMVATSGESTIKLTTLSTTEVIMDAACSSVRGYLDSWSCKQNGQRRY